MITKSFLFFQRPSNNQNRIKYDSSSCSRGRDDRMNEERRSVSVSRDSTISPERHKENTYSNSIDSKSLDSCSSMNVYVDRLAQFPFRSSFESCDDDLDCRPFSTSSGEEAHRRRNNHNKHSQHMFILINEEGNWKDVLRLVALVIALSVMIGCFQVSRRTGYNDDDDADFDDDYDADNSNDSDKPTTGWIYVSKSFGYIYFLSWTISNWPQLLLNHQNRSTEGLSPDFVAVNCIGFVCYAVYNSVFYWSTAMQDAYVDDHNGDEVDIRSEDVFLSLQTTVLILSLSGQILFFNATPIRRGAKICPFELLPTVQLNPHFYLIIKGLLFLIFGYLCLVALSGGELHRRDSNFKYLNWTDFAYSLSYVKLISTLTKYIPQILLNRKRRSTSGFNIWTAVFDCLGGIFSFLQVAVDSIGLRSFGPMKIHHVKLLVGVATIIKNIILMMQHYIWYNFHSQSNDGGDDLMIDDVSNKDEHPLGYFALHCDDTEEIGDPTNYLPLGDNETQ